MTIRVSLALGALLMALAALAAPASAQSGVQTLHFKYGPVKIAPGQNTIEIDVPRVDVIHLHHGVWLSNFKPLFAAGEEKTEFAAPPGYGWRYRTTDPWHMNHMIHNLTPTPTKVYITYDLDFVPATSPLAASMREIQTVWMDVVGGAYPVFDAKRGRHGDDRRLTYPDEVPGAPRRNTWTSSSRGPAAPCGCSARRRSTTSPPGRSRGTSR